MIYEEIYITEADRCSRAARGASKFVKGFWVSAGKTMMKVGGCRYGVGGCDVYSDDMDNNIGMV